jgi:hypothetical protein
MTSKTRKFRPSPALVISCVALFMALAGSAYAVGIGKNTVRSPQVVNGSLRSVDLHNQAVTAAKIAPDAVGSEALAPDSVTSVELAPNAVTAQELAENAVETGKIAPKAVTSEKIAPDAVGATQIAPHAVGAGQLGTVTVRTNTTKVAKGGFGTVSVSCAEGEQVLSGGAQPGHFGTEMTSSRPSGNGWLYQAVNNTAGEETLTVFALCLAG